MLQPGNNEVTGRRRAVEFDVHELEVRAELREPRHERTVAADDERPAVEDQLVLTADLVDVHDGRRNGDRPVAEHLLAVHDLVVVEG